MLVSTITHDWSAREKETKMNYVAKLHKPLEKDYSFLHWEARKGLQELAFKSKSDMRTFLNQVVGWSAVDYFYKKGIDGKKTLLEIGEIEPRLR